MRYQDGRASRSRDAPPPAGGDLRIRCDMGRRGSVVIGMLVLAVLSRCSPVKLPAAPPSRGLEVTCVGPEGFLIRSGDASVLIDGFISVWDTGRDNLMRRTVAELVAGEEPFNDVTAALVSHAQPNHFDAVIAGEFLESHPQALMAATPEVRQALEAGFPRIARVRSQIVPVDWDARGRFSRYLNGVQVDFFKLPHEASEFYDIDVSLHVLHLKKFRILHGADPEMLPGHLAAYHLQREDIDLALLPYSFLASPGADEVFAAHVGAKEIVAMHLPPAGIEEAKRTVRRQFPNAVFLTAPLQSRRF